MINNYKQTRYIVLIQLIVIRSTILIVYLHLVDRN